MFTERKKQLGAATTKLYGKGIPFRAYRCWGKSCCLYRQNGSLALRYHDTV